MVVTSRFRPPAPVRSFKVKACFSFSPPSPTTLPGTEERRGQVTQLLQEASGGNRAALDRLIPLVYDELKAIGRAKLRREPQGHTLNATALVHEAYVTLVEQDRVEWHSSAHFFAVASLAMRRILISYARAHLAEKRGSGQVPVQLEEAEATHPEALLTDQEAEDLVALDEALSQLKGYNASGAEVVEYRFFGGMAHKEIAQVTGVSEVTVRRRWTAARAWLRAELDVGLDRSQTLIRASAK